MQIISWNMNKRKAGCWEWLFENHSPDIVMAQEASPLPNGLTAISRTTTKKSNRTVTYSKDESHERVKMEYDEGMGILVSRVSAIYFINVYANLDFEPVDPPLLGYIAKFVAHLRRRYGAKNILISGDFNMDRRMDDNPTGTRFALKDTYPTNDFFDAILDMGFLDCVGKFYPEPVQTHRNNKSKFPWEIDHMFATPMLFESLSSLDIPNTLELSDHNPIIANFS